MVVISYRLLTIFAASFQQKDFFPLVMDAVTHCLEDAAGEARMHGCANVHSWLTILAVLICQAHWRADFEHPS